MYDLGPMSLRSAQAHALAASCGLAWGLACAYWVVLVRLQTVHALCWQHQGKVEEDHLHATCGAVLQDTVTQQITLHPACLGVQPQDAAVSGLLAIIHGICAALRTGYRRILLRADCPPAIPYVTSAGRVKDSPRSDLWVLGRIAHALLACTQLESWRIEATSVHDSELAIRYALARKSLVLEYR
jgi:hypothetical protein